MSAAPAAGATVGQHGGRGRQLVVLTASKWISNVAYRWISVFLPTLVRAFGTTTGTLTTIMGLAELGGFTTSVTGRWLDRGHERRIFLAGTLAVAASAVVALGGSTLTFAVGFVVLVIGVGNLTVAGHAWIAHRYEFTARGRAIGTFETSWAFALLLGAPVLAGLIDGVGWRGPFVALAAASLLGATAVRLLVPAGRPVAAVDVPPAEPLPRRAYVPMIGSAATAAAGLGMFVVSGAWLDERYGVSTGGLGAVAAMSGAVELVSSAGVAAVSDRVGARRSVVAGLCVLGVGATVMATAGDSRTQAIAGLLVFLAGFEYGFVSSLTLVSEAAPASRGRAIGVSNALGTVARAVSVTVSGLLFDAVGIGGSLAWVGAAATLAMVMVLVSPLGPGRPGSR